ncbi:hypothetical protein QJS10_CPA01g00922 [Acorus calamus]|uniref:tRNA-uridine aminocarboxypropyltransferase n=1 Tax=Acorus calamus TaxID=4465 RepID=A0AAV9FIV4_ACOCL|nr:hypothetical protein QJS10_CPA01g00922 [Acorus calamus]
MSTAAKRPVCTTCSKPSRLCLCRRLKSPPVENSIHVTILQHSLEKDHPLNSTRIAVIGLKSLSVVSVSDVHYEAEVQIRPLKPGFVSNRASKQGFQKNPTYPNGDSLADQSGFERSDFDGICEAKSTSRPDFDWNGTSKQGLKNNPNGLSKMGSSGCQSSDFDQPNEAKSTSKQHLDRPIFKFTIPKHGRLDLDIDIETISKGFVVKRSQKKPINGTIEEFELAIPPGTALLFPSDRAVEPHRVGFESEVRHLIVLDATWAKAKRMYHENPWLKLLPHLKLEPEGTSLYSEVRHQPKMGCLSTIESVVCALKALGDDAEGLDGLLEVFESMVADQRRCKAEKLSGVAASS